MFVDGISMLRTENVFAFREAFLRGEFTAAVFGR